MVKYKAQQSGLDLKHIQTLQLAECCVSACDPVFVLEREAMDTHSTSLTKPKRPSWSLPPSISK